MVSVKRLISFQAQQTALVKRLEDVHSVSNRMVNLYSQCYFNHNFSFRVLLPRSTDNDKLNHLSKKLGLSIQTEFLLGIKKLKLKTSIQDYRYIHDKDHYGWLLLDPSFTQDLR